MACGQVQQPGAAASRGFFAAMHVEATQQKICRNLGVHVTEVTAMHARLHGNAAHTLRYVAGVHTAAPSCSVVYIYAEVWMAPARRCTSGSARRCVRVLLAALANGHIRHASEPSLLQEPGQRSSDHGAGSNRRRAATEPNTPTSTRNGGMPDKRSSQAPGWSRPGGLTAVLSAAAGTEVRCYLPLRLCLCNTCTHMAPVQCAH